MEKTNWKNKMKVMRMSGFYGILVVLFVFMLISLVLAVGFGSVEISSKNIVRIIANQIFNFGNIEDLPKSTIDIIYNIRLPRILLGLVVGIALAISGVIMQAVVKNSLADPYILGISSGASLGATLAILFGVGLSFGYAYVGISACIIAFLASVLVMSIANLRGRANPIKLILSGVAVSSMFSAFSSFIIYTSPNRDGMKTVSFWLMGGLSGAKWDNMPIISVITFLSLLFFLSQYRTLNLMLLGDDISITLGKDLHRYRQVYLLVVSVVIGFVVYNSGIIGFVGLIVPHIARLFFGTDHKKILPISAVLGAIALIWADVVSRVIIAGSEVPVGIVISLIGSPFFIYLLISREYSFKGGLQ